MVGDGRGQVYGQAGIRDPLFDFLAPVGVDLAGQVDVPVVAHAARLPDYQPARL